MFVLILLACSSDRSGTIPIEPSLGWTATADTGVGSWFEDSASDETAVSDCYELEYGEGGEVGCFETRPYLQLECNLTVLTYGSSTISWDIDVTAAPEGWVLVNNLGFWLNTHDESGSGWTDEVMNRIRFVDQNGDEQGLHVVYSNPGGKSLAVGEIVSAEGDVAVPTVNTSETATVTVSLDVEGLDLRDGDKIRLDLNPWQTWSSEENWSTESDFGGALGTEYLFE